MNKSAKLDMNSLRTKMVSYFEKVRRYNALAFVVLVAVLYGVTMYEISSLGSQTPSEEAVSKQVKAARIPRIDPTVVRQLQSLQDNSVSVQALFDEARSNPFDQ